MFGGEGGWLFADGESWDYEEEGEIGEERVGGHILTFTDGFTDGISVGETVDDSDGTIDTSLHGSAISNPSVIPSVI